MARRLKLSPSFLHPLVLALPLLLTANLVHAKTMTWDRITTTVQVLPNGDLDVSETRSYTFDGEWNGSYRTLDVHGCDGFKDIQLWEGNHQYVQGSVQHKGGFVIEPKGQKIQVRWRSREVSDPPYDQAHLTFILKYKAIGAVRVGAKGDTLNWNPIDPDRDGSVGKGQVIVILPKPYPRSAVKLQLPPRVAMPELPDPVQTFWYGAENVPPGGTLEFEVTWPHGDVTGGVSAKRIYREKLFAPLWLLEMIGALVLILVIWSIAGREPPVGPMAEYLPDPPSNLPPGEVGCLCHQSAGIREVVATILDLSRRGIMRMDKVGPEKDDLSFVRVGKDDDTVTDYEKYILMSLAIPNVGDTTALDILRDKFYTSVSSASNMLQNAVTGRGFWLHAPSDVRLAYWGYAFAAGAGYLGWTANPAALAPDSTMVVRGVAALLGVLLILIPLVSRHRPLVHIIAGVGLLLCGAGYNIGGLLQDTHTGVLIAGSILIFLLVGIVGYFMPQYTQKGAEEKAKWAAFERYLRSLSHYGGLTRAEDILNKYLPYAYAFGIQDDLVRELSSVQGVPAPIWIGNGWGTYGSPGWSGTGGAVGGAGGANVPSLQGISDSLLGGLQSMSNSLTSQPSSGGGVGGGGGFGGGGGGGGGGGSGGW